MKYVPMHYLKASPTAGYCLIRTKCTRSNGLTTLHLFTCWCRGLTTFKVWLCIVPHCYVSHLSNSGTGRITKNVESWERTYLKHIVAEVSITLLLCPLGGGITYVVDGTRTPSMGEIENNIIMQYRAVAWGGGGGVRRRSTPLPEMFWILKKLIK